MFLTNHIYPLWLKSLSNNKEQSDSIDIIKQTGLFMSNFFDIMMIRKLDRFMIDDWLRYYFSSNVDREMIEIYTLIGSKFIEFNQFYFKGKTNEFVINEDFIELISSKLKSYNELQKQKIKDFEKIRNEVKKLRREKLDRIRVRNKKSKKVLSKNKNKNKVSEEKIEVLEPDFVYNKWMEHVDTKVMSKSYWYIHEYIGRFILEFAKKSEEMKGRVTEKVVQTFLDDYGKNKRPKTMNHYNRVAKYFLDFYRYLEKNPNMDATKYLEETTAST